MIAGWNAYSGTPFPLSRYEIRAVVDRAMKASGRTTTCAYSSSPVTERTKTARESGLTIFGYGNYAKTMIVSRLGRRIPVRCVHEIDPWQIRPNRNEHWSWDTSPTLRTDERPDVVVIAGFHHTHAGIAVQAMKQGARAVIIEKPIVTTDADLELLCAAAEKYMTPVFASFQKRYSPFNQYIFNDLQIRLGEPVSCFSIVYEVPLPPQHWYRWPNSGSRIISNGCHWIDHFLYLNDFSPARQVTAIPMGEASTFIHMVLENEAVMSLSLTHEGSPRLGMREHCEFRANGVTATITDGKKYRSESAHGTIRKARTHRFSAYQRMYRSMSEAITAGADGDSLRSLRQSCHAVLAAEAATITDAENRFEGQFHRGASTTRPPGLVGGGVSAEVTAADRPERLMMVKVSGAFAAREDIAHDPWPKMLGVRAARGRSGACLITDGDVILSESDESGQPRLPACRGGASGQPVIARDTAENREIAGPVLCGYTLGDPNSLRRAVEAALTEDVAPDPGPFDPDRYFGGCWGCTD